MHEEKETPPPDPVVRLSRIIHFSIVGEEDEQ